jgi:hypothetical protein
VCSLRNRYQESEPRGIQKSPFSLRDVSSSDNLPFGPSGHNLVRAPPHPLRCPIGAPIGALPTGYLTKGGVKNAPPKRGSQGLTVLDTHPISIRGSPHCEILVPSAPTYVGSGSNFGHSGDVGSRPWDLSNFVGSKSVRVLKVSVRLSSSASRLMRPSIQFRIVFIGSGML